MSTEIHKLEQSIAIIGMTGRFPGAKNITEFWQNLCDGVEAISQFSDEELIAAGVDPSLFKNANYIKAGAVLDDIDLFDAGFFGFNPKEAEMTDPQHRLFLECAWEALENAGYDAQRCESRIGVYAGASLNNYLPFQLNIDQIGSAHSFQKLIGNDKDFLSTRVSYKLNLTGPSLTIQTACSTSLVATALACQSLLNYQCDMALAGGASIRVPQKTGYLHQEGGILSSDGHCRAFDAKAKGTIIGNGVGVVLLKRLLDAIADGDHIYAVIKGSAINNDGSNKVGYTAPSVNGQAEAIAEAIALADVEPETISYIETHGTGTALGDPIEIAALTNVFRAETEKTGFCAIGSVKTNIGHLDAAAGVTGLIKTALALQHKLIPPSLNFEQPNPEIDFANSPFYVNTKLTEWSATSTPRRAGVSSLGIGGTNAHVILEEAPLVTRVEKQNKDYQLLVLSAKTDSALETATKNLAQHLRLYPELNLADVAYTLQVGRGVFNYRRVVVCQTTQEAINALESIDPQQVLTHFEEPTQRSIIFMFPGQGAQYVGMGKELYQTEPTFREQVDCCCLLLEPHLGLDLRSVIYAHESEKQLAEQLKQTSLAQPALFVIEYALAQLWMSWGISPQAMIGHSIGEYVAACLAGVMSLEDALTLVAVRGRLMQQMATGAMLAVSASAAEVKTFLNEDLALAASNAPSLCVVSGSDDAVNKIAEKLTGKGIECRSLHTSHAFHSQMMEPMLEPFITELQKVKLNPPQIPFISNLTGTWISAPEATSADYWAQHLRQTVQFSDGLSVLLQETEQLCCAPGDRILLEVGPGRTLCTLVKQHTQQAAGQVVLPSLRHPQDEKSDINFLLNILGRLWLAGIEINWSGFYTHEQRYRVPLPTYPFERQRYWIEPEIQTQVFDQVESKQAKKSNISDWFYIPSWKRVPLVKTKDITSDYSLIFVDEYGVGSQLAQRLQQLGQDVITVKVGEKFAQLDTNTYAINPAQADDYQNLLQQLREQEKTPNTITHLWSFTQSQTLSWETTQNVGFYSLLYLAQAIGQQQISDVIQLCVIANHLYDIAGNEELYPEKTTIIGACKVIPQEYQNISCRLVDILLPTSTSEDFLEQLLPELTAESEDSIIAYRNNYRWVQRFEPVALQAATEDKIRLRQKGVYLITGGMGGIGLVLAEYLAKTVQAKLVLLGRSLPCENEKIKQLEALGAEVLVLAADVTNYEQMQSAIAQSLERFGTIHGVIHTAGIAGAGMIQLKTPEIAEKVFAPKIQGTLTLNNVLKNINLDFLVLCSSLSSIQGGFGQVDYCAANTFLDAFAHWNTATNNKFTVAINWDAWQQVGMAVNTSVPDEIKSWREENLKNAILPAEGADCFSRILATSLPQFIVSTQDLQLKTEQLNQLILSLSLAQKPVNSCQVTASRHSRTLQENTYIAPSNEIEQTIANIWEELIGIEKVGIHDNFFELGGHSLLAVQTISRLREAFQVELPLRTLLFDAPTISELANVIVEKQPQSEELNEIAKLLAEVENLSLEELDKQLAQESPVS
ncbi:type I polyketide synthase [aff. Roholtiella sp. LEGE 12411]|uniref:type I polyketide synthase n=1 Tax=aff. Roholtiella sp. LEGE 12411 TaxID=1828822 RepID=UPI00187EC05F|nr:type I polyketide synthase [aff. Roholtiella sp. LEGE 12411]MBE9034042.1 SDR family NAD(P)-dependent oxidoreductase [aff. Roholtiella sp. LEGE 12411]